MLVKYRAIKYSNYVESAEGIRGGRTALLMLSSNVLMGNHHNDNVMGNKKRPYGCAYCFNIRRIAYISGCI